QLARTAAAEAAGVLQSEADSQLDRRRREQDLITALLSSDAGASAAAAAILESDRYLPQRPFVVCVAGPEGPPPDGRDRSRSRAPAKHAVCGEVGGRATVLIAAQGSVGGAQLAEALRSVLPADAAGTVRVGVGHAVDELTHAPASHRHALAALRAD